MTSEENHTNQSNVAGSRSFKHALEIYKSWQMLPSSCPCDIQILRNRYSLNVKLVTQQIWRGRHVWKSLVDTS